MQQLDPAGIYTDAEVKAALAGATGSRDWAFRYARLDSNNDFIEDIDYVQSCTIDNSFLADIKRTAKFNLVDTGNINYLSDRIQPFVRLNMPKDNDMSYRDLIRTMRPDAWYTMNGANTGQATLPSATAVSTNSTSYMTFPAAYSITGNSFNRTVTIQGSGTTRPNTFWGYFDISGRNPINIIVTPNASTDVYARLYRMPTGGTVEADLVLIQETNGGNPITLTEAVATSGRYYVKIFNISSTVALLDSTVKMERGLMIPENIKGRTLYTLGAATFGASILADGTGALRSTSSTVGFDAVYDATNVGVSERTAYAGADTVNVWLDVDAPKFGSLGYSPFTYKQEIGTTEISFKIESISGAIGSFTVSGPTALANKTQVATVANNKLDGVHNITFTAELVNSDSSLKTTAYWDGKSIGTVTIPSWPALVEAYRGGGTYGSATTSIGANTVVDEFSVFRSALSSLKVFSIYNAGLTSVPERRGFVEWPQGVFILSSPTRTFKEGNTVIREVEAYDQLLALKEESYDYRYSVEAGANCVNALQIAIGGATRENLVLNPSFEGISAVDIVDFGGGWTYTQQADTVIKLHGTQSVKISGGPANISIPIDSAKAQGREVSIGVWIRDLAPSQVNFGASTGAYVTSDLSAVSFTGNATWTRHEATAFFPVGSVNPAFQIYVAGDASSVTWIDSAVAVYGKVAGDYFDGNSVTTSLKAYGWNGAVNNSVSMETKTKMSISPSNQTFTNAMDWEPGTSRLQIANDILGYINYESSWFDENGYFIARPYVSPANRGAEFTYATDAESVITSDDISQTFDVFNVPNKWILVVSDPEGPPMIGTYLNDDPMSPTSTVSRGRVIVDYRTEQGASDQLTLDAKAARLAAEASQIYEKVSFSTGLMPIHSNNDVYNLIIDGMVINSKFSETSWSLELTPGSVMKHEARRIVVV